MTRLHCAAIGTRAGIARAGMVQSVMTMVQQPGMAQPTMMQSGAMQGGTGGRQQTTMPQQSGEHIRFHATIVS